jgi:hypothetical protein
MRKSALQVTLDVREPSVVELTVGEKVQLDRLVPSDHGHVAERHGSLLDRGVATLSLEPGFYFFKTLSDANLKVIRGGVTTGLSTNNKDNDPRLPPISPSAPPPAPDAKGDAGPSDEASGVAPVLTVE